MEDVHDRVDTPLENKEDTENIEHMSEEDIVLPKKEEDPREALEKIN